MKESVSIYIQHNNSNIVTLDDEGHPMNETRVDAKELEQGRKVILRFRNGLLDGDVYVNNQYVTTKPAVEAPGHIEYWRAGKLHRDNGLPAVLSFGFTMKEFWENGIRIK